MFDGVKVSRQSHNKHMHNKKHNSKTALVLLTGLENPELFSGAEQRWRVRGLIHIWKLETVCDFKWLFEKPLATFFSFVADPAHFHTCDSLKTLQRKQSLNKGAFYVCWRRSSRFVAVVVCKTQAEVQMLERL